MRVAIASPTVFFREEICKILGNTKDIEVVAEVANISEAMSSTEKLNSGVLVIDADTPNLDLINVIQAARKRHPRLKVLLLMNHYNENTIISAMRLGAIGWLLKDTSSSELIEALRALNKGESWVDKRYRTSKGMKPRFTKREAQVVQKLTEGQSNKAIARELFISEKTVKAHLSHIYQKLNIQNRYQLLSSIIEQQFIEIEPKGKVIHRGGK